MQVKDHKAYDKMLDHMVKTRVANEKYIKVNNSYTNDAACSIGEDCIKRFNQYFCYYKMATNVSTTPCWNKEGYGLLTGYSWMDGRQADGYEACTAWHDWLCDPKESPWKLVLKGGDAIEVLRLPKGLKNAFDEPIPEGLPYGYLLMYHKDDVCTHTMHFMIALRCVIENVEFVKSWYEYVKLGYPKVRAMLMAYELVIKKDDKTTTLIRGPRVDNFQFFMIDGAYNENLYENGPYLDYKKRFSDKAGYLGTSISMSYTKIKLNLKDINFIGVEWRAYINRTNVKLWSLPRTDVVSKGVRFYAPTQSNTIILNNNDPKIKVILDELNVNLDKDKELQKDCKG